MFALLSSTGFLYSLVFLVLPLALFFTVGWLVASALGIQPDKSVLAISTFGLGMLIGVDSIASLVTGAPRRSIVITVVLSVAVICARNLGFLGAPLKINNLSTQLRVALRFGPNELVAGVLTALFMAPLMKFGSGYFTRSTNDWPNYIYSVLARTEPTAFTNSFSGNLANYQLYRANGEKPGATTALYYVSEFFGRSPTLALTSVLGLILLLTAAHIVRLLRVALKIGPGEAMVAAAFGLFNPIVASRFFDAQLGHALTFCFATALVAELFCSNATSKQTVMGVHFAALLLVGPTLALAILPILFAALVVRHGLGLSLVHGSTFLAIGCILASGETPGLVRSIRAQTTNEDGFQVAFPSPSELLGLQPFRIGASAGQWLLVVWVVTLVLSGYAIMHNWRDRGEMKYGARPIAVSIVLFLIPLCYFILSRGAVSYQTHKYLSMMVIVAVPIWVGLLLRIRLTSAPKSIFFLALTPLIFFFISSDNLPRLRVGYDDFEMSDWIKDKANGLAGPINIATSDIYLDSYFPALISPVKSQSVAPTYASATYPISGYVLTKAEPKSGTFMDFVGPISHRSGNLQLSEFDLQWREGQPLAESRRHMTGDWYPFDGLLWTAERRFFITIDQSARGNTNIDLSPVLIVPPRTTSTIQVYDCKRVLLQEHRVPNHTDSAQISNMRLSLDLTQKLREGCNQHDVIEIVTPPAIRPAEYGMNDNRTLTIGFSSFIYRSAE